MLKYFSVKKFSTKKISFGSNARKPLAEAVNLIKNTVKLTLGPGGRNVAIDSEYSLPKITKDGVTVAKNIQFFDRHKQLGALLLKRASHQTNMYAGDGTTTSTIIASSILEEGCKYISQYHVNPIEVKKGIDIARNHIIDFLEEIAIPCAEEKDFYNVACVSSNYDQNIANIVKDAIMKIGKNGTLEIEPGHKFETQFIISDGISINRGFVSEEFITLKHLAKVDMINPLILIANQTLKSMKQLIKLIEMAKSNKQPVFIICKDMTQELINNLVFNLKNDVVQICVITVPGFGNFTKDILDDFGVVLGGHNFDENDSYSVEDVQLKDLGKAIRLSCNAAETFIMGAGGTEQNIEMRKQEIQSHLNQLNDEKGAKIFKERIARLGGKMGLILCGGGSEIEVHTNRDMIVDALNSVKMAMEHGMLPGGSSALVHGSKLLDHIHLDTDDKNIGVKILQQAIRNPFKCLLQNAAIPHGIILDQLLNNEQNIYIGYDINQQKIVNMKEAGILDSLHVVKNSLLDATSVGTMLLTTEVSIVNEKVYFPSPLNYYKREAF